MKIVIDANGLVTDEVALLMAYKVLDRDDGTVKFTGGYAMEIRSAKTQKSFKVVNQTEKVTLQEPVMTNE